MSAQSVQLDEDSRLAGRGRHRAPSTAPVARSRARARAFAAMTTGTVAVSGVALAGCATDVHANAAQDESTNTAPVTLAAQIGSRAALGGSIAAAAISSDSSTTTLGTTTSAQALTGKVQVGLKVTNPDETVAPNEPVDIGFSLYDEATHAPLANQLVKVQVKLPTGWATFQQLYTNDQGYASYTARVLTTTNVTAVFDGTDALQSAHSINEATLHVEQAAPVASHTRGAIVDDINVDVDIPLPASSVGEKAVYLASLQAGKPYVYGADGPSSFDCSGLVQYIYRQLGKTLPRTTDAQFAATTRVSMYNKQPGDLIFLGTPGNIYHVGIYAGDGKMWVAPHTGDVVKLQTIYTTSYYVGRV
ncbi:peptidoglycan DL-endopeptidase CwlO [Frankia sp. AiPs1]|uniref:C40 family peptidase n=1 Tax=Frankia sp. AiPa1 TaxID=573492 RepID=UPI00202AD8DE|nr:C40 family peptidase [Frankia sp. AiPa1]MCL9761951.1 C40 family peptidase [Frankia sp. AiPa1]